MRKFFILTLFLLFYYSSCLFSQIVSETNSFWHDMRIVSKLVGDQKFLFFHIIDNREVPIDPINSIVSGGGQIFSPSLSFDGRLLYFSAKYPGSNNFDIYYSVFDNNQWSNPSLLDLKLSSVYDELFPVVSPLGDCILFVRKIFDESKPKRSNYYYKLYYSLIDNLGKWSIPSSVIISDEFDISPLILHDNRTVVFSSKRTVDGKRSKYSKLYYTRILPNNNWLDPILIGNLESPVSDFYPLYSSSDKKLYSYFSSHFTNAGSKVPVNVDVHKLLTPVIYLSGNVFDEIADSPLLADVSIYNALNMQLVSHKKTYRDGFFALPLISGKKYLLDVKKDGYTHNYYHIDASNIKCDSVLNLKLYVNPILSLEFNVYDIKSHFKIPSEIIVTNKYNKPYENISVACSSDFRYSIKLPLGRDYHIHVNSKGYESIVLPLSKDKPIQFNKSSLDIELNPLLKHINFRTIDSETLQPVNAELLFENVFHGEKFVVNLSDSSNSTILRKSDLYDLVATADGYIFELIKIDLDSVVDNSVYTIPLTRIKPGAVVQMQNVNFAYNSSELIDESLRVIDNVYNLLIINPDIRIELSAHTDDIGGQSFNLKLSEKRAESVMHYLLTKGIPKDRIETKGYGMSNPLVPNDTDQNRAINRRVEFRIL